MARNKFDIDETLESPFNINHLKRSMVYINRYKGQMILALSLSLIAVFCALITPQITKYMLDVIVPEKNLWMLLVFVILLTLSIVLNIFLNVMRSRITARVGQNIVYDIRQDLFEHLQQLPFAYYDSRPHGKILVRVVQYVNNVSDMLSNGIINFVLEICNLIFVAVFMFLTDAKLACVIIAGLPILAAIVLAIKPAQRKAWQIQSNKNSNMNAYIHESITGASVTQIFAREKVNAGIADTQFENVRKSFMKAVFISNWVWVSVEIISVAIQACIYGFGILVFQPMITFGTAVAMCDYSQRFWRPITNLANLYNNLINTMAYLERIFETIDEPVLVKDAEDAFEMPTVKGEVCFKNVCFSYEEGHRILDNINFTAKPGQTYAFVGPTGAGKSTIVNLICRFYNVDSGQILIDGTDIANVTIHSLRTQMGIMMQDSFIFSGTIMDNIRYGNREATDDQVIRAAKTVCAHDFISQMENGYYTEVNERGSRLSAGQRQLISFARALLADPKILILDEATSSIDTETEILLQKGLNELLKGRTSFIIAHRLSTIKNADCILYVDKGGILERGTHEELLEQKGAYYDLYISQYDFLA